MFVYSRLSCFSADGGGRQLPPPKLGRKVRSRLLIWGVLISGNGYTGIGGVRLFCVELVPEKGPEGLDFVLVLGSVWSSLENLYHVPKTHG